ncbi:cathelicidin-1-like [Polyodon spathula]|uniref:cathelicidin-1-like n=1 Tax=Polyodon spathula TaxID=7913 RepID=UPI001B7E64B5|nr:cathelicidin-1-like [Polyodon spathula]
MKSYLKTMLLVGLASLLLVAQAEIALTSADALSAAIEFYNRASEHDNGFKQASLLQSLRTVEDGSSEHYKLKFNLQETVCLKSENYKKPNCTFMENGLLLKCSALVSVLKESSGVANIAVTCDTSIPDKQEEARVKRGVNGTRGRGGGRPGGRSSIGKPDKH